MLQEETVREALKQVIDPELFVNIVDLGLVYGIDIKPQEDQSVEIEVEMTLTSPMCPAGPQLVAQTKQAVSSLETVTKCDVRVVMEPPWGPDRMTEEARDQLNIF
jgi:metal-sulfur cluster biosynthetic enzyme